MVKFINAKSPNLVAAFQKDLAQVEKISNLAIRKEAYFQYDDFKTHVAASAPKSGRPQRFSKKKGRPLVPMSYVEDLKEASKGWKIRRRYYGGFWEMILWHSDKGSLLHLLEFGTIHRPSQPWMRSTWDVLEKGILGALERSVDKALERKGYRKI